MSLGDKLHVVAVGIIDMMVENGNEQDAHQFGQLMDQYARMSNAGQTSLPAPNTGNPQMDNLVHKILKDLAQENVTQTATNAGVQHVGQGRGHGHGGHDDHYHGGGYYPGYNNYWTQPWWQNYWYQSWYPYYYWNTYPYVGGSKHKHDHKKVGQAMGLLDAQYNSEPSLRVLPPGPSPYPKPGNNNINAGLGDIRSFNMNCGRDTCSLNLTFRRNNRY